MHNLFLVYFVNLYTFRASLDHHQEVQQQSVTQDKFRSYLQFYNDII